MSLKEKIHSWLSLIRLPNLFTVPGDVILGYIIAESCLHNVDYLLGYRVSRGEFASYSIFYTIAAILCAYIFGLITNDIADIKEDMLERPYRPIPSGKISVSTAYIAAGILFFMTLFFAILANMKVFFVIAILLLLVISYNAILKQHPRLGPLAVSLCRLLSITAGFYAAGIDLKFLPPMFYIVSFTWILYFLRVSLIAYNETEKNMLFKKQYFLLFIPAGWFISVVYISGAMDIILMVGEIPPGIFLAFAASALFYTFIIKNFIIFQIYSNQPKKIQAGVGDLIKAVIFLQSSACAFLGYPFVALAIFITWIPAHIVSRIFYSS